MTARRMPPDVWLVQFGNRWFMRPWRPAFMAMAREVSRLRHIEECADELVQYESDLASSSSRLAALARADIALGELGRIVASHTKKEMG